MRLLILLNFLILFNFIYCETFNLPIQVHHIVSEKTIVYNNYRQNIFLASSFICSPEKVILIPEKIIYDYIYNHGMFFDYFEYNFLPLDLFFNMIVYTINNKLNMEEFTDKCKSFNERPFSECPIRFQQYGIAQKTNHREYIHYSAFSTPCRGYYISYVKNAHESLRLLSNKNILYIENYNYSKLLNNIQKSNIFIAWLSNIHTIKYNMPCLYNPSNKLCSIRDNKDIIFGIINHYKIGIYTKLCDDVYDLIKYTNGKITYRIVSSTNINEITDLKSYIAYRYKIEYHVRHGDNHFYYYTNQINYPN